MGQRTIYYDDLDETEGAERITFALEGKEYEIDLSEKNAERLRSALQEFIEKARPVVARPATSLAPDRTSRRRSSGSGRDDIQAIRQWAKDNGYGVSPRGRIKQEVINAYEEAHK
ncbi:histone-like nucleoid-structuring protein Lsr2 [Geodermatophilus sp. URMC 65]